MRNINYIEKSNRLSNHYTKKHFKVPYLLFLLVVFKVLDLYFIMEDGHLDIIMSYNLQKQ